MVIGLSLSKYCRTFGDSSSCFRFLNASWQPFSHENIVSFLHKSHSGAANFERCGVKCWGYVARPRKVCSSFTSFGAVILLMVSSLDGSGSRPEALMMLPKNGFFLHFPLKLSGFNLMPFS